MLNRFPKLALVAAVAAGLVYGLASRFLFGPESGNGLLGVMTFAFIFLVPLGLGALTVHLAAPQYRRSLANAILTPWAATVLTLLAAFVTGFEGMICIVMIAPAFLVMASIGGVTIYLVHRIAARRGMAQLNAATVLLLLALPYLIGPLEQTLGTAKSLRVVETQIRIHADAATVWANIARVPEILPHEQYTSLAHVIGFPKPLEATLSYEGVGGVRHATFERGVLFVETVTVWEPLRRLAFTIHADPDQIPARALDEHVTVGGPYFDVLDGEYVIEPLADGAVMLHLRSTHRLSTSFNPYARLWTDWVMRDVQNNILQVVRDRAERGEQPAPIARR
jgi:hypothetical protein